MQKNAVSFISKAFILTSVTVLVSFSTCFAAFDLPFGDKKKAKNPEVVKSQPAQPSTLVPKKASTEETSYTVNYEPDGKTVKNVQNNDPSEEAAVESVPVVDRGPDRSSRPVSAVRPIAYQPSPRPPIVNQPVNTYRPVALPVRTPEIVRPVATSTNSNAQRPQQQVSRPPQNPNKR